MIADYPAVEDWASYRDPHLEDVVTKVQDVVSAVRKLKALFGSKGQKPDGKFVEIL